MFNISDKLSSSLAKIALFHIIHCSAQLNVLPESGSLKVERHHLQRKPFGALSLKKKRRAESVDERVDVKMSRWGCPGGGVLRVLACDANVDRC